MRSECLADETASPSASWSWWTTVRIFVSGIFFGITIAVMFLYWKSSLQAKFQALLGYLLPSSNSHLSPAGHQDKAPIKPKDSETIKDSPSDHQDTASVEPSDYQADSTPTNLQSQRPSTQRVYKYDVFLSFRGPDVRKTFVDHLYNHLINKGIFAFKDDETLETGEPFPARLLDAVKDSRAAIVVFSMQYPESFWCLEEMSTVAHLHRESEQIVLPVFYNIAPSDVGKQSGEYETHFNLLNTKFASDRGKVDRWKKDMKYLSKLNGYDIRNKRESTEIERITEDVIDKLDHKFPWIANHLIGVQPRIEELEKLLELNSEDDKFRILGICGMGGIGKTALAKVLFNKIAYQFDATCFIEDISKFYGQDGGEATKVQRIILQQTLKDQNLEIYSPDRISRSVQSRLCNKNLPVKVLIVLDNVDEQYQWDKLAIDPYLLGRGSRVIMTTRNKEALEKIADYMYEVPLLNTNDARELFLRKTFKSRISESGEGILEYAQSLPLAIEALGYFFNSIDEDCWEEALESLRKCPNEKIMNVLQKSFEELRAPEKEIFLHIACFFRGKQEKYVKHILDSCGMSCHRHAIQRIMKKSLITIRNHEIHMHKMLQELGKDLVRRQFPDEPALWSRLWHHRDFEEVLLSEQERSNVKAIVLDQEEDVSKFSHLRMEGLSKMNGLKLLILRHEEFSMSNLDLLLNPLHYIMWHGYPFSSLSLSTWHNLVELNLPNSSIHELWNDDQEIRNLKRLDLSNSKNLTQTPNFKSCSELVWLDFTGCTNLSLVHESIRLLAKLDYFSLRDCSSLEILDLGNNCQLSSLRFLHLSGCTNLKNTPDFTGVSSLNHLDLELCTSLSTVHESIGALAKLKYLSLKGCKNLIEIPKKVHNMTSLQTLDLNNCKKLKTLPPGQKVTSSSCLEEFLVMQYESCSSYVADTTKLN